MDVNWVAVVVAAFSAFVLGGIWYSMLFAKPWMRLSGVTEEQAKSGNPAVIFGGSFVLSLIAAATFAMFLGREPGVPFGVGAGACAGLAWVAASVGINYLFERKPLGLFLINGGYHTLQFTLYGLVLGLLG